VSHIPSRIKLCKYLCQYDSASPLDKDSLAYLNQVWPRLMWRRPGAGPEQVTYLRIDWDGIEGPGPAELVLKPDAPPPQEPAPVTLEGDQCLVFFLGGIPATVNGVADCTGFSRNLHNPAAAAGERISPFYEFKSSRLVRRHGNPFYSYLDAYGEQPFAYFSAYGRSNG